MRRSSSLDDAVAAHVRPGMSIHVTTQSRASVRALLRVFRGRDMDLTLIVGRVGGSWSADLVASGLVSRVISGSYGMVSPNYTGRLRQVGQAYRSGKVRFEHWTFWTLMQRLIAAAQGLPYALTHSLADSAMVKDNPDWRVLTDPFDGTRSVGAVRALHPDLAFVHVDAADEDGNAIMLPPLEEGAWGAKASREGAIVTAERIVDREFIRRHAHLVKLPARYTRTVCHAPFGAHPGAFGEARVEGFDGYAEDTAFSDAYAAATRDTTQLQQWVDTWIAGSSHDAYLARLGANRLAALRQRDGPSAATPGTARSRERAGPSDNEVVMVLALREVMRRAVESGCDVFLVGAGLSEVPATAAYRLLQKQGHAVTLAMGHGYFGFEPQPGRSASAPGQACMSTDTPEMYGVILGGRPGRTLAILGAAQIDRMGNLNSTYIDGQLLVGSGGSNDASAVCETLVVTRSGRRKLVEQVEYVTCSGRNVRALITEFGVFEKAPDEERLRLVRYLDRLGSGREAVLKQIAEQCGWPLEVDAAVECAAMPTAEELDLVRALMPARYEE